MGASLGIFRRGWQMPVLLGALMLVGSTRSADAAMMASDGSIDGGGAVFEEPGSPVSDQFILGPTAPGKWGGPVMGTPGGVVTWSLTPTGTPTSEPGGPLVALADFMPVGFHAAIVSAFAAWSAVADITFVEVPDNGLAFNAGGAVGDIRISGHAFDGAGGVLAHGFYPPTNGTSAAGDIHFDTGDLWVIGFPGPGFDIFQVAAHEIGHAIGLNHTGVPGSLMNPFYSEAFSGPQADDIAGAVFIYGPAPVGPPTVPEPGSVALLVSGVLAFGWRVRRQQVTQAV